MRVPSASLPGPRGSRLAGNLGSYEADRLGFLLRSRDEFGPLVRFNRSTTIVNDPTLAGALLSARSGLVVTENFLQQPLPLNQDGRLESLKRVLNPALRLGVVGDVADAAASAVSRKLIEWGEDRWFDPTALLDGVVAEATARHFFGAAGDSLVPLSGDLLDALASVIGNPFALPASWGGRARRRITAAHSAMQAEVIALLGSSPVPTARPTGGTGVGSALEGRGHESGWPVQRTADALIGALLAAHRVPVAALSWMLLAVAIDPDMQARLLTALRLEHGENGCPQASGTRTPQAVGPSCNGRRTTSPGEPTRTSAAQARDGIAGAHAVLETLRLHPPTWLLTRRCNSTITLGSYEFSAGHNFMISPYVLHRDPGSFTEPDAFKAERWVDLSPLPDAYMPFGRGLHRCPGESLAWLVMEQTLAVTMSRWVLSASGDLRADPRTTLTPAECSFECPTGQPQFGRDERRAASGERRAASSCDAQARWSRSCDDTI